MGQPRHRLIIDVARRWRARLLEQGAPEIPLLLDITLTLMIADMNGLRLDIDALLAGPIEEVEHDVGGIFCNINRGTGKLEGLFQPRFILKEPA